MTSGYELTTGLTNICIVVAGIIAFFRTKDKYWKIFYILCAIDGSFGVIIHCFPHEAITKKILWSMLTFTFAFTVNTLLLVFLKTKTDKVNMKHVSITSIILYVILLLEVIYNKGYLLTFILYCLVCMIIITAIIIKNGIKNNLYYFLGVLVQFLGGTPMLFHDKITNIPVVDVYGIYHLILVITIILFRVENKNKKI